MTNRGIIGWSEIRNPSSRREKGRKMNWEPMTDEQQAEFERLESESDSRVGGTYRLSKWSWVFGAAYTLLAPLWFAADLSSREFTQFGFYGRVFFIIVVPICGLYHLWIIWRDERYGILENGLARVTRRSSELVPWERIESAKKSVGLSPRERGNLTGLQWSCGRLRPIPA